MRAESRQASSAHFAPKDFVVRMPPSPAPAPLARWRRAQAVTRAVVLVSARVAVASIVAMAIGFLTCGEEWPVFRDSRGENCPAFRASRTAFLVSMSSVSMASCVYELLSMCVSLLSNAEGTLKSPGGIAIVTFACLPAGAFLLALGIHLESWSAKGSPMETVGSVTVYAGMGMMALSLAGIAVMLCVGVAFVSMIVWQCFNS